MVIQKTKKTEKKERKAAQITGVQTDRQTGRVSDISVAAISLCVVCVWSLSYLRKCQLFISLGVELAYGSFHAIVRHTESINK